MAQLAEQLICNQQVIGSSPIIGSMEHADVAQLAEQLICNQQVIGSSPIIGSMALWLSWLERPPVKR